MERNLLRFCIWLKERRIVMQTATLLLVMSALSWPAYATVAETELANEVSVIPSKDLAVRIFAFTVTGKVTANNGDPLPGVSVVEKGTSNGTVTDNDGIYNF